MKKCSIVLCLWVFGLLTPNLSKAQLIALGFQYQKPFSALPGNLFGGEVSRTNWFYDAGAGFTTGKEGQNKLNKLSGRFDVHLLPWHHGYSARRLVPYVGAQYELRMGANNSTSAFRLRTGLKLSYDYFIFDCGYMPGDGKGTLNARLAYVIKVGAKCVNKRIGEIKPFNFLQF
jgi:hypothetical protein